ncbi:MAG: hypothetical protein NTY64_23035 [Deltaproteobacteria bacterium]|nr:hypothetical protein [Deltaproteobacteria bacterium]
MRFTFVATALRAGSRETRESFLRSHLFGDFLRDHQIWLYCSDREQLIVTKIVPPTPRPFFACLRVQTVFLEN